MQPVESIFHLNFCVCLPLVESGSQGTNANDFNVQYFLVFFEVCFAQRANSFVGMWVNMSRLDIGVPHNFHCCLNYAHHFPLHHWRWRPWVGRADATIALLVLMLFLCFTKLAWSWLISHPKTIFYFVLLLLVHSEWFGSGLFVSVNKNKDFIHSWITRVMSAWDRRKKKRWECARAQVINSILFTKWNEKKRNNARCVCTECQPGRAARS